MQPAVSVLIGGILPFGAVFVELFFILSSLWLHQVYAASLWESHSLCQPPPLLHRLYSSTLESAPFPFGGTVITARVLALA